MATLARSVPTISMSRNDQIPRAVVAAASLTGLGALAMVASGAGYRTEIWQLEPAFRILAVGAAVASVGLVLSIASLASTSVRRGQRATLVLLASLIVGLVSVGTFASCYRTAKYAAPIHDVTTDTDDPPTYEALKAVRERTPYGLAYRGAAIAALQHAAYPDIKPARLTTPPYEAYRRALIVARAMGWELARTDSVAFRIEGTATTPWYGFKDDIVIRVRPDSGGSRVDVRAASRLGEGDAGTNAALVRRYLAELAG